MESSISLMSPQIAALFVDPEGTYSEVPGVELWGEDRDARLYDGDKPIVGHPPCARWGRYAEGGPSAPGTRRVGDDDGCFASCLATLLRVGGVIEHPEASHAYAFHGITRPPQRGGWVRNLTFDAWVCCVFQGHYGHRSPKATWLLARGCELPALRWGRAKTDFKMEEGFHSREERRANAGRPRAERLSKKQRMSTPSKFRDLLIETARSCG